jgi:thiamine-phosphate pyrophosphorylase
VKGLYAILDLDAWRARGVDPQVAGVAESIAEAMIGGGATTLQLRGKHESGRDTLSLLRRLRAVVKVPLYANDRADLAALADCDGVHVGQDDLPAAAVRRCFPRLSIGVSTHSEEQLRAALAEHPDYVAFGPVFGTTSKERPDAVVGLEGVRMAAATATIPLVVIGGIDRTRLASVRDAGARCFAVISDLIAVRDGAPDLAGVEARARAFS